MPDLIRDVNSFVDGKRWVWIQTDLKNDSIQLFCVPIQASGTSDHYQKGRCIHFSASVPDCQVQLIEQTLQMKSYVINYSRSPTNIMYIKIFIKNIRKRELINYANNTSDVYANS